MICTHCSQDPLSVWAQTAERCRLRKKLIADERPPHRRGRNSDCCMANPRCDDSWKRGSRICLQSGQIAGLWSKLQRTAKRMSQPSQAGDVRLPIPPAIVQFRGSAGHPTSGKRSGSFDPCYPYPGHYLLSQSKHPITANNTRRPVPAKPGGRAPQSLRNRSDIEVKLGRQPGLGRPLESSHLSHLCRARSYWEEETAEP